MEVINKFCLKCGKKLLPKEGKTNINPKRKFCNFRCQTRYKALKWYSNHLNETWQHKHRERYNLWRKKYYKKNKEKIICNIQTYQLLIFYPSLIKKHCKICGSNKELEIHHEEYNPKRKEIKRLIKEGKIYFLCKKHHALTNKLWNGYLITERDKIEGYNDLKSNYYNKESKRKHNGI